MRNLQGVILFICMSWLSVALAGDVPAPLQPWTQWVLEKHPDAPCPRRHDNLETGVCGWPGSLRIDARAEGAEFEQSWQLFAPGWVLLPGDARHWPLDVRINEQHASVLEHKGRPAVWLNPGAYQVTGRFAWEQRPARLGLPPGVALIELTLDGVAGIENLEADGSLLLGSGRPRDVAADSLDTQVFRKLEDDVPLRMETRVKLAVSGKDREIVLGRLLLEGSHIMRLESPLPARIEANGDLRIQVRAGEWSLVLWSRSAGQPTQFTRQKSTDNWPEEEIWVFSENTRLRQVSVQDSTPIDSSQTLLPTEWRSLPAYLMRDGDTLSLLEQQRGDSEPAPAELTVTREAWLDFDGKGYTFRDRVSGNLARAGRLAMAEGYALGRADVNGAPQLITRLTDTALSGLEVRQGQLDLMALSRLEGRHATMAASGWAHDMASLEAKVYVPPGWLLLHANGPDTSAGAWLAQWDLWGIFLVLIIAAASFRQWGLGAGVLAGLMLVLTYHETDAPVMIWLYILISLALLNALPTGRLQQALRLLLQLGFIVLAVLVLQFAVTHVRLALYPQLEQPWKIQQGHPASLDVEGEVYAEEASAEGSGRVRENSPAAATLLSAGSVSYEPRAEKKKLKTGLDPDARIQTGPGEPAWEWREATLRWSGPVVMSQTVQLYWLSPLWHSLLRILSVLLVLLYAAGLVRAASGKLRTAPAVNPSSPAASTTAATAVIAALVLVGGSLGSQPVQAEFPSPDMLSELETRLLKAPDCAPACANINSGSVQVSGDILQLGLQLDTNARVAVPMPVNLSRWQPRSVLVDGVATKALRREDSQLWLMLPAGTHQVVMEGPLTLDSMQLQFSLPARNLQIRADGWQVTGFSEGRVPSGSLELRREQAQTAESQAGQLLQDPAPPFVKMTRRVVLGMEWEVETQLSRLAPEDGAIALQVPLLPGEAVLTTGIRVKAGSVQANFGRDQQVISWRSSLKPVPELLLSAAENQPWVEQWVFDISPRWHVDFDGLAPTKQDAGVAEPVWRPWPGEQLKAVIQRPEAVPGPTRTLESARLVHTPGARTADTTLEMTVRSSQGGEWILPLPSGSTVQKLVIDGIEQSHPSRDGQMRVSLHPGVQAVQVEWRQAIEQGWRTVTPLLEPGEPVTNIDISLKVPEGRWLLWVAGPAVGPAVLVWGVLVVMMMVAIGLGRSGLTPLKTGQWLLLGVGMSTANGVGSIPVMLWFLAMSARGRPAYSELSRRAFNFSQVGLVLLTLIAGGYLLATIPMSLLSEPDMQVAGNGSGSGMLNWYQDHAASALPQASIISLPIMVYRIVMLLWSLWMVFALLGWCRWGWSCFSATGLWRPAPPKAPKTPRVPVNRKPTEQTPGPV